MQQNARLGIFTSECPLNHDEMMMSFN